MSDASRAHLYGVGVFTTVRILDGVPWLWDKHWRRLMHDAEALGLDLREITEDSVRQELEYGLEKDELRDGRARITLSDARSTAIWPGVDGPESPTTLAIITGESRKIIRPFRVTVSPHLINSTSPLAGLKTSNYLEEIMALDDAHARGFAEAIRVNERGEVASGCMANVFWSSGAELFTPALSTRCLPGTTREFLIESVGAQEIESDIDELRRADAIFLTSAGLGVVQVDEFGGRPMKRVDHGILSLIPS